MIPSDEVQLFRDNLLAWFSRHQRDLPWRRTRRPYAIWISEVMLQQTRVAAVVPFYERFMQRFPTFHELAAASESDLLAHWAGLGYYYRARNLQKAARLMVANAAFPSTYEEILSLPGIGEYTAAAVGSISFGLPYPVVDGNVYRVLSRVLNDETNIASSKARKHFTRLAEQLLEPTQAGAFNQAVMELGATICLPKNPQCLVCPVAGICRARKEGRQNSLPVKTKPKKTVEETRKLFWFERAGEILLWQRPAHSRLMPGFWELPEIQHLPTAEPGALLAEFRHGITFHNYRFLVTAATASDYGDCKWLSWSDLNHLPLSTIVRKAKEAVAKSRSQVGTAAGAISSSY